MKWELGKPPGHHERRFGQCRDLKWHHMEVVVVSDFVAVDMPDMSAAE